MTTQTLMLSQGYEPIEVVSWQRAITLLTLGKVSKKGGRTPQQAGMQLRLAPVQPRVVPIMAFTVSTASAPDAWRDYLYWTSEIDPWQRGPLAAPVARSL